MSQSFTDRRALSSYMSLQKPQIRCAAQRVSNRSAWESQGWICHAGIKAAVCEMPFARKASDVAGGAGGTCVLRGCVPKKLMVYGGEFGQAFKDSIGFG